jgi:hypothetical protein
MSAFFDISGTISLKGKKEHLEDELAYVKEDIGNTDRTTKFTYDPKTETGVFDFTVCGYMSYGFIDELIDDFSKLKNEITYALIMCNCDDDHTNYTWDNDEKEFIETYGEICFSSDEAEEAFNDRPVPYKELLRMFQDYVNNDASAADLSYVQDALSAVGVDKEKAELLGLGYVFDAEEAR